MDSIIFELEPYLIKEGYKFRKANESLFVELPNGFGELQIYHLEENDDVIGLVGSEWHTHSDCLEHPDMPRTKKIIEFVICSNSSTELISLHLIGHLKP